MAHPSYRDSVATSSLYYYCSRIYEQWVTLHRGNLFFARTAVTSGTPQTVHPPPRMRPTVTAETATSLTAHLEPSRVRVAHDARVQVNNNFIGGIFLSRRGAPWRHRVTGSGARPCGGRRDAQAERRARRVMLSTARNAGDVVVAEMTRAVECKRHTATKWYMCSERFSASSIGTVDVNGNMRADV
jgi:hypothetical protein